jgi:hypothetical protein
MRGICGGKFTVFLMLNLVVHRENTRSLMVLDPYTYILQCIYQEHVVAQLVVALPYRRKSRGFDSQWVNCDFLLA